MENKTNVVFSRSEHIILLYKVLYDRKLSMTAYHASNNKNTTMTETSSKKKVRTAAEIYFRANRAG